MEMKITLEEIVAKLGRQKGIDRVVDLLGRIVIPKEYRTALNWNAGDIIEGQLFATGVLLVKKGSSEKTGTDRMIDILGRAVVPRSYRAALNIQTGDAVELQLYENAILLLKK